MPPLRFDRKCLKRQALFGLFRQISASSPFGFKDSMYNYMVHSRMSLGNLFVPNYCIARSARFRLENARRSYRSKLASLLFSSS